MRGYVLQDTTQKYLYFESKHGHNAMVVVDKELTNTNLFDLFLLVLLF